MRRRSFLSRLAAVGGAGVAGLGATAGCVASVPGAGDDGPPSYADRLYAPSEVTSDLPNRTFASYDLATLYDRREVFPEEFANTLARFDTGTGALSVPDLERATTLGLWRDGSDGPAGAGSAVVRGSFDPDAVFDYLRRQAPDDVPVQPAGTAREHDLYTVETPDSSVGFAVSEETVFAGVTDGLSATGERAARAMLGSTDAGYYRSSDVGERLVDALGDPTTVVGWEGETERYAPDSLEGLPADEELAAVVSGLRGAGTAMTLDDTVSREVVGIYADGETPTRDDVETVLDVARQAVAARAGDDVDVARVQALLDDTRVTAEGQTLRLAVERETDALFPDGTDTEGPALAGGPVGGVETLLLAPALVVAATFVLGFDGGDAGPEDPTPAVSLDFAYDADAGEVTVTHAGGDTLTERNTDRVLVRSGDRAPVVWELPVAAGDSTTIAAASDDTVLVLWTAPGGEPTATLGSFEVP